MPGCMTCARQGAIGAWLLEMEMHAMQQLFEQAPDIDRVFASSDDISLGAVTAAVQSGRRVPDNLALVGFDNIPQSAYFQPLSRTDRAAIDLLLDRFERRRSKKKPPAVAESGNAFSLELRLVVRVSSGQPTGGS